MKKTIKISSLLLALLISLSNSVSAQQIASRIGDFKKVGSNIEFTVYLWAGPGYTPNDPTGLSGYWGDANMRWDINPVGGGTIPITTIANFSVSDINTTYLQSVTKQYPIGSTPSQPAAPIKRFGVSPSRGSAADLPLVPTPMFKVTIPFTGNVGQLGDNPGNTTLFQRTENSGVGSFWSRGDCAACVPAYLAQSNNTFLPQNQNVVLPVVVTNFDATKAGVRRAKLAWATEQEHGSSYFEVQRSANGKSFNTTVGRVTAAGNSSTKLNYQTYDNSPLLGTNYYRLKMVDADGKFAYSEIRKVSFDVQATASLYPNPCVAATSVKIVSDMADAVAYTVTDMTGKLIFSGTWDIEAGASEHPIDLGSNASGMYMINLKGEIVDAQLKIAKLQ